MRELHQYLFEKMVENNPDIENDKEIYHYGIESMLELVANLFATICIILITGEPLKIIIFMVCFVPLRSYAGGFHFNNKFVCFAFSIFLIYAVAFIGSVSENVAFMSIVFMCSGFIIIFLAPVESINKPLDNKEISVFRRVSLALLAIEGGFAFGLYVFHKAAYAGSVVYSLFLVALLLVLGKIKNQYLSLSK